MSKIEFFGVFSKAFYKLYSLIDYKFKIQIPNLNSLAIAYIKLVFPDPGGP